MPGHDGSAQVITPADAGDLRLPGWNRYIADGAGSPSPIITPLAGRPLSQAGATVMRLGPRVRRQADTHSAGECECGDL